MDALASERSGGSRAGDGWRGSLDGRDAVGALQRCVLLIRERCLPGSRIDLQSSLSTDWHCMYKRTGLAYLPHQDSLLVSLSSSAFYHLSLSPHLRLSSTSAAGENGPAAAALSPSALTSRARDVFEQVLGRSAGMKKDRFETTAAVIGGQIGKKEGAKVVGMVVLNPGGATGQPRIGDVAFIYE